jgi:hypothetical protein
MSGLLLHRGGAEHRRELQSLGLLLREGRRQSCTHVRVVVLLGLRHGGVGCANAAATRPASSM